MGLAREDPYRGPAALNLEASSLTRVQAGPVEELAMPPCK